MKSTEKILNEQATAVFAQLRTEHEQKKLGRSNKVRAKLNKEFHARNRMLADVFYKQTDRSKRIRAIRSIYNIRRFFVKILEEWNSPYLDTENSAVRFEQLEQPDGSKIVRVIAEIPYDINKIPYNNRNNGTEKETIGTTIRDREKAR